MCFKTKCIKGPEYQPQYPLRAQNWMFMAGKDLRVKNKVKYVTSASSLFFMQGEKVK